MLKACSLIVILAVFASSPLGAQTMRQRQQREANQKQVELRLNEVRQKFRGLNASADAVDENTRNELKRLTAELSIKQETAERKLAEMKAADGRDWERCRAEANAAVDALNSVYNSMQSLKK
jgi:hypothetical protein